MDKNEFVIRLGKSVKDQRSFFLNSDKERLMPGALLISSAEFAEKEGIFKGVVTSKSIYRNVVVQVVLYLSFFQSDELHRDDAFSAIERAWKYFEERSMIEHP